MTVIELYPIVGSFAENKDMARDIRVDKIVPALNCGDDVIIDFDKVDSATQSFIHALVSELIRNYGAEVLDRVMFKNCNETVRKIVSIVVDYMQESE